LRRKDPSQLAPNAGLNPATEPNPKTQPYRLLDAWRGVAALWVVLLHSSGDDHSASFFQFSLFGLLGVPMFFVISGYCIAHAAQGSLAKPRPLSHFLLARLRRIYPPYFFASLATILLATLLALFVEHHILNFFHRGWRYYLGALTLTQPLLHVDYILPVFWSLSYEAAFYAIVAAFLLLAVYAKQRFRMLDALGLLTVGTLIWLNLAGSACPFPWNRWPQFGFGALVYQVLAQPRRKSPRFVFLLCSVLMMAWAIRLINDPMPPGFVPLGFIESLRLGSNASQSLFCLPFALLLILLFRWDHALAQQWAARLFSRLGLFSYSVYLSHYITLRIVVQGTARLPLLVSHPLLLFWVKIAVCIGGGRLFFQLCEQPFLSTRQRQVEGTQVEGTVVKPSITVPKSV
jgi:exopolysaccharide production protein ExoZ